MKNVALTHDHSSVVILELHHVPCSQFCACYEGLCPVPKLGAHTFKSAYNLSPGPYSVPTLGAHTFKSAYNLRPGPIYGGRANEKQYITYAFVQKWFALCVEFLRKNKQAMPKNCFSSKTFFSRITINVGPETCTILPRDLTIDL